jgi:MIP family channel proteins
MSFVSQEGWKLSSDGRELSAEFLGTLILMVFGLGVNAQTTLSARTAGDFFTVNLGWGLAVTMGVFVAGGVSGAHLNPAVTLAFAATKRFPWRKVLPYIFVQMLAAFIGAFIVYLTYFEALQNYDSGIRYITGQQGTAGIFSTFPQPFLSNFPGGFVDQVLGTGLLVLMIFAMIDRRNTPAGNLEPVMIGSIVLLVGMTFGFNAGYAINPARDLGPRIFMAVGGWGPEVFTVAGYWWWVPVVAPCVGGVLGGFVYDAVVTRHHPASVSAPSTETSAEPA